MNTFFAKVIALPGRLLIGLIRLYQIFISPMLGSNCRFRPSCSNYFIQAVHKYGVIKGGAKGIWRICKCHPLHPGGDDLP